MAVEQHQNAGLLDGTTQHQLHVCGAGRAALCRPQALVAVGVTAEIGRIVDEERLRQALRSRPVEQRLQVLGAVGLQARIQRRLIMPVMVKGVEVERG